MKNKQRGFIVPVLIAIIAVLVVGGGIYVYSQNNKSSNSEFNNNSVDQNVQDDNSSSVVSNTTANVQQKDVSNTNLNINKSISDQMILDAENVGRGSQSGKNDVSKFVSNGKGGYVSSITGGGSDNFSIEAKGDINSDGYEDAVISRFYCGASCGNNLDVVINDRNGSAHKLDVQFPNWISSGAGQTGLKNMSINNGMISVTANGFEGDDRSNNEGGQTATRNYRLVGDKIISVNANITSVSNTLSNQQIETATFGYFKIKKVGNDYIYTDGSGRVEFNGQTIVRGDINNDGLEDAVVITRICGAGCFGYSSILIAINNNGSVKVVSPQISNKSPHNLEGKTDIKSISIVGGKVNIIYTNGTGDEAKMYQLQSSTLVEN